MDEVLHANIFFLITSVMTVIAEDVAEFRAALKEGGWFGKIISFVLSSAGNVSSGKRTRKK
jgi:uncharacterized membrane protein YdjX (TVP38/TMEM64 family)